MARRTQSLGPEAILAAARRRFLQWGFSGTSTSALAEDLGITKAALYYHYPDKEALFLAVIGVYLTQITDEFVSVKPLFEQDDGQAALEALAQVFLSGTGTSAQIQQLSFQESRHLTPEGKEALMSGYHTSVVAPLSELLGRAVARGWLRSPEPDEPQLIWIFFGLVSAFLRPGHGGAPSVAPSPQAFVRLLTGGIGASR